MAKTIESAFSKFLSNLTPSSTESQAAQSHRASIESCLRRNFTVERYFRTGSFGHGTSIRGYSDVDYFAVLSSNSIPSKSKTALTKVRNALDARFPNTGVTVRSPAVTVPFGSIRAEHTEIVPARFYYDSGDHPVYEIADGNDGWMAASPEAHNEFVSEQNDRLSKKVKPLIRFLKAWKYYRNVPIHSFYLELYVANYAKSESSIVFRIDIQNIFGRLHSNGYGLSQVLDPKGISGLIDPCNSESQRQDALSKLKTAYQRAQNANQANSDSRTKDEFYWWGKVFNGNFPEFG